MPLTFEGIVQLLLQRERHRSITNWFCQTRRVYEIAEVILTNSGQERNALCAKRKHGLIRSERQMKHEPITHYCTYCETYLW